MLDTRTVWGWAPLVFLAFLAACASPQAASKPGAAPGIPAWVNVLPKDAEFVYALGYSPKTFYLKDAFENAKNAARVELAKNIQVSVKETLTDTMVDNRRAAASRDTMVSVSQSELDAQLKDSEIAEVWQDKDGLAGEAGAVYALARVKRSALSK